MGRAVEKLIIPKDHVTSSSGDQAFAFVFDPALSETSNSWSLIESCKCVVNLANSLHKFSFDKGITQQVRNNYNQIFKVQGLTFRMQHADCLKEGISLLAETPIPFPRFFFQTLQSTRVKVRNVPTGSKCVLQISMAKP